MRPNWRFAWYCRCGVLFVAALGSSIVGSSQNSKWGKDYPAHLPYEFSNFVWWNNDELRAQLKKRIPGLGDEIATTSSAEQRVREALKALLKEKGIVAEVQSEDPSLSALKGERVAGAPEPAVVFSVLSPQVLVGKVIISHLSEDLARPVQENFDHWAGRNYSSGQDWLIQSGVEEALQPQGYLESKAEVSHDAPRLEQGHYSVNILVAVDPGVQYRIASIEADGGPLLKGRDLSQFFGRRVGEIAVPDPFGRLAGELRAYYWRYGYADVSISGSPTLDRAHGLASYRLSVMPGPLYHLHSLTIHNLNAEQERRVREMLGLKVGDVFNLMAVNDLNRKLLSEPLLQDWGFSFSPVGDQKTAAMDLTLDFFRNSDNSSVTIK